MPAITRQIPRGLGVAVLPLGLLLALGLGVRFLPAMMAAVPEQPDDSRPPVVTPHPHPNVPKRPVPKPMPVDAQVQKAVELLVAGQIDAIGRGDYDGALRLASRSFRESWTPDRFRDMIVGMYPPLIEVRQRSFDGAKQIGDMYILPVTVVNHAGERHRYLYQMAHDLDGNLRVTGCSPIPDSSEMPGGSGKQRDAAPPLIPSSGGPHSASG